MANPQESSTNIPTGLEVVVLAAGQGTRMRSSLPKVLHELAGSPLINHVLHTVESLEPARIHVVVGHQADEVQAAVDAPVCWVTQERQLGTGHAVGAALPAVSDDATVLVVFGDVPLVSAATLSRCVAAAGPGSLALVTAQFTDPAHLGRIVRDDAGFIREIVEYADADESQRQIREINSGILALNCGVMKRLLAEVVPKNAQGEYYLTDLVALAVEHHIAVNGIAAEDPYEVTGVNDRIQLAELERHYQHRIARTLMRGGVSIADPSRLDVRGTLRAGEDCFLDVNVVFEGTVTLGRGVHISAGCVIKDAELGDFVRVEPHTVIDGAQIGPSCQLGPFARLRPGADLAEAVKIGNFVEIKKTTIGRGSKASHLAYLGDATIGENCNVGAGTVTCNYDGASKHPTRMGDRVFVGTNSTLVAPLDIDADAFIAAGSTITARVGENQLGVGRSRQRNIEGWTRPDRKPAKKEP